MTDFGTRMCLLRMTTIRPLRREQSQPDNAMTLLVACDPDSEPEATAFRSRQGPVMRQLDVEACSETRNADPAGSHNSICCFGSLLPKPPPVGEPGVEPGWLLTTGF